MGTGCVFCAIAAGSEPAEVVYEDDRLIGFLDHRPVFPGHVLLLPRAHVPTLVDLPQDLIEPLFGAARLLAAAVPEALGAQGTFVAMNNTVSQSVPHLHVHVVPRTKGDGLRGFFWPRERYRDDEHLRETADAIRAAVSG
jgi:histidine triad (HIT) family protein